MDWVLDSQAVARQCIELRWGERLLPLQQCSAKIYATFIIIHPLPDYVVVL